MKISGIQYNEQYMALEVYVSGCTPPHCPGCHNEEAWGFDVGMYPDVACTIIQNKLSVYGDAIKQVWILGGEPLDQDLSSLKALMKYSGIMDKPTVLWTRYYKETWTDEQLDFAEGYFEHAKVGGFIKDLPSREDELNGQKIVLASNNQYIIKL